MKLTAACCIAAALILAGCSGEDGGATGSEAPSENPTQASATEPSRQAATGMVLDATVTIDGAANDFDIPDASQIFWCLSTAPNFSVRLASSTQEGLFAIDDQGIEITFPDESYSGRFDAGSAPGAIAVDHGDPTEVGYALDVSYEGTLVVDSTRGGTEETVDVSIAITCSDDSQ